MKDIVLYIDGNRVEWQKTPDILLTYQRTDYQNPTITKNMFSKTITIEGTQENNNIFNHIWKLDRVMDDNNILFNPSQKVPFQLYNDAEIVEQGYCKLDSISKEGYKIAYNITLFGGLGSFFYSLAYDSNDDKEKTLADLNFTGAANPEDEFDFEINKNTVWNAWDALKHYGNNSGSYKKWDYVNFIPCYNGLPDEFDSDKCLINVHGASGMTVRYTNNNSLTYGNFPTSVNNSGTAYTPHNGYVYAEMQNELNEWEMRDLRSYLQRPGMSVMGFFDAICRPENNGGYNVVLDQEFFSTGNPYYHKAWITLPKLSSSMIADDSYQDWNWYDGDTFIFDRAREMYMRINNYEPFGETPDLLRINCEIHATFSDTTANKLYMSTQYLRNGQYFGGYNMTNVQFYINRNSSLSNVDDIASSNRLILFSKINGYWWQGGVNGFDSAPFTNKTTQLCPGYWQRVSGHDYVWTLDAGGTEITIDLETNRVNTIPTIGFYTKSICNYDLDKCGYAYDALQYESQTQMNNHSFSHLYQEKPVNVLSKIGYKGGYTIRSYQNVKKKHLLGGIEGTPCDWLLSYCKLFGLFIEKDKLSDTIYIKMRKNWYRNEKINLEDLIDRSKNIDVTPLTFESKWYNFNYNETNGKFLDKYKDTYSQDFGKQLIDTNYNFDADEIDLLEDNSFNNGLVALEKSNYYNIKKDTKGYVIFPCLYNWCTVNYYKDGETYGINMALPAGTTTTVLNSNRPNEFYDFMPKLQLHDDDNGGVDGDGILVFFNGLKNSGEINYWLTDDVDDMFDNSDKPCWLMTLHEWNTSWSHRIAIKTNVLPEFNRYVEHYNILTASWDFGRTKEIYVPYYRYDVNKTPTIYENFWQAYINDLYSINTRKVDCYVSIDSNDVNDFMKRFYWWDNCIWVCTKVTDFDIAVDRSTLCSFTKVNDINAYFDTPTFDDWFFSFIRVDGGGYVPAQGTDEERSVHFSLDSSSDWVVIDAGVGYVNFDPNYPTSGNYVVGQEIVATFMPNFGTNPRPCTFVAGNNEGQVVYLTVIQEGYVKPMYLNLDTNVVEFPKYNSTPQTINIESSADWQCNGYSSWASLSITTGHSGTSAITITATDNEGTSQRSTVVYFSNNDGNTNELTIQQKGHANVRLEQQEIFPVYTVPAGGSESGRRVFYRLVSDIECQIIPMGNTENYAVADGLIEYNTIIQPTSGTNFWIQFSENKKHVSRNAAFYAYFIEGGGRFNVFPTIVKLPLQQLASGNSIVDLNYTSYNNKQTQLDGAGMRWTATTNTSWITLLTSTGSMSNSTVSYRVTANNGKYRVGYIYVTYIDEMGYYCDETIEVRQKGTLQYLTVTPNSISCDYKGGQYIISVSASSAYNITSNIGWLTTEAERSDSFILKIGENSGYSRTGSIYVTSGTKSQEITISQGSIYPSEYILDCSPQNISFDSDGGTIQMTIRSNSPWQITGGSSIN